jgi:hypothetical protein
MQKTLEKNLLFVGSLSASDEKSRIRIRKSVSTDPRIRSIPKCHGSSTDNNRAGKSLQLLVLTVPNIDEGKADHTGHNPN